MMKLNQLFKLFKLLYHNPCLIKVCCLTGAMVTFMVFKPIFVDFTASTGILRRGPAGNLQNSSPSNQIFYRLPATRTGRGIG